ncbi:hypothetical protein BZ17_951 [Yersinia pseudotuberculosis IP 32953]|uniref:Uncharacterized protein n=3 Tax=Yersinia pseudotuberculosis TaxID=633 RepID=Q66C46_YERPS|nr:hypothetical protein [Yersinia pseudotuberculosis]CQD54177.1 Uncharacterised protein [Yersinia intermedia]AJJ03516.1 hypothetical protein BZ21_901 [Yersinia pseudotuberculosis]AJJ53237.1 hypothetical protein BZ17_951 [Yersinia pseudotuberculosis IP 32953]AJJ68856.1 hypothetical protein BZ16_977 [Yersinia pseudotuberculosis PB1/+]AJJ71543.1 hypothetical protein BZ23_1180 [Yersinia pseudotuberculosis]
MSNYINIARRIAKIILSPDSAIGLMHGVLSVPKDLGYLVYGYLDTDSRYLRETEHIRMAKAIRYGILQNHNFVKTIETVLGIFNKYVPKEKQESIYSRSMFSLAGRTAANSYIFGKMASIIAQRTAFLVTLQGGAAGNILLIGGMAERSVYTSRSLQRKNPEIYYALYPRNYDLLYFLIEPALEPFVEALQVRRNHGDAAFNKIIDMVENELKTKRAA